MKNVKNHIVKAVLSGAVAFGLAQTAPASLVTDGGFEWGVYGQLDSGGANDVPSDPEGSTGGSLTYWSSTGYNFLCNAGNVSVPNGGVISQFGTDLLLNGAIPTVTYGGNFVAMDADWPVGTPGTLSQTINGLTPGGQYTMSFYMALTEATGNESSVSAYITASLGTVSPSNPSQQTTPLTTSGSSTAWSSESINFTATGSSELLSLAAGSPDNGAPPFLLIGGVSLSAVPEPTTIIAAALLLLPIGASLRRIWRKPTAV